jgi:nucleoside 2-deoxyribosyltransferase
MNIYFAGSIRGGRGDKEIYMELIQHLKKYGTVLTEHVGDKDLTHLGDDGPTDRWIYERDIEWLAKSDVVIAEVSIPSLGVGYELAKAEELKKKILCLYRKQEGKKLSAMVSGNKNFKVVEYITIKEAKEEIDRFLGSI